MKNFFSFILALTLITFVGCSKDSNCVKCEIDAIFAKVTTEACEDGNDLKVTTEAFGIKSDTIIKNTKLETFKSESIAEGFTCK